MSWLSKLSKYKNVLFITLLIFLILRVFIPQLDDLREAIAALNTANLYWVLLGLIVYLMNAPLAALQLLVLALKPVYFGLTLRVQVAVLFVSKLLPQSVGSISLNVFYLIKKGHSASQSAAVMTMDGITSAVAYTILIILGLLLSPLSLEGAKGSIDLSINLVLFIGILLIGVGLIAFHSATIRKRIKNVLGDLKHNFSSYRKKTAGCDYRRRLQRRELSY